jgi:prenyltransferase beta subunit
MRNFSQAILLLLLPIAAVWAEDGPVSSANGMTVAGGADKYRQVVVNAVSFLDGNGAKLEKGASCINCHHAPLRGWALREAARFGLDVDAKGLQDATNDQLQKLSELKDDYRDKQWGHSLSSFYLLGSVDEALKSLPKESVDELAKIIIAEQSPDGSWKAAQQFGNQRRPKRDANQVQTMWSVLALSRLESHEGALAARDRGLAWLKSVEPGTTIDARALRLVVEQRWGKPDQLLKQLLESQHPDGGWGWQPGDPSEAWPTGLALYALSLVGDKAHAAVIDSARSFLAKTQKEDGSWLVEGKLTKNSDMSSYFGTAWAIVGLSRTQPTK